MVRVKVIIIKYTSHYNNLKTLKTVGSYWNNGAYTKGGLTRGESFNTGTGVLRNKITFKGGTY